MLRRIVGVDFGRTEVRAAQIKHSKNKGACIEKLHAVALPDDAWVDGVMRDKQAIAGVLQKLWKEADFDTKRVVIAPGSLHVFARQIDVPQMSLQRIRESLPFVLDGVLPVPADQLFLDFYPIQEGVEESGLTFRGLAVAAEKQHVESLTSCVTAAGLRPVAVDFAPFAILRASVENPLSEDLHVYIEVGGGATYFIIARGRVPLFVRTLPNGGRDIDRHLASALKINEAQAEQARKTVDLESTAKAGAEVRAAVLAAFQDLLSGLSSTVDYFEQSQQVTIKDKATVSLSGGVANLKGLDVLIQQAVGMPVVATVKPQSAKPCKDAKLNGINSGTYLLAVGLGLSEVPGGI